MRLIEENIEKVPYNGHPWTLAYELLTEKPEYVGSSDWDKHHYFKDNICFDYYQKVSRGFDAFLEQFGLFRKNGLYECKEDNDKRETLHFEK